MKQFSMSKPMFDHFVTKHSPEVKVIRIDKNRIGSTQKGMPLFSETVFFEANEENQKKVEEFLGNK